MKEAQQIATDSYPFRTVRDKPPSERRGLRPREGRWLPMRQEAERAGMESQASRCSASTHLESHLLRPFQNPGLQDGGGGSGRRGSSQGQACLWHKGAQRWHPFYQVPVTVMDI